MGGRSGQSINNGSGKQVDIKDIDGFQGTFRKSFVKDGVDVNQTIKVGITRNIKVTEKIKNGKTTTVKTSVDSRFEVTVTNRFYIKGELKTQIKESVYDDTEKKSLLKSLKKNGFKLDVPNSSKPVDFDVID